MKGFLKWFILVTIKVYSSMLYNYGLPFILDGQVKFYLIDGIFACTM